MAEFPNLRRRKIHRNLRLGRLGLWPNRSGLDKQLVDSSNLFVQLLKTFWDDGSGLLQRQVLGSGLLRVAGRASTGMSKL